ncbi:MAG: DUF192 domain-containing protein [Actinomycetota bacterium]|nr:DUF192 domain-containing protein [Actinomycetota bacterium]
MEPRRFEGAPRLRATASGGELEVVVAGSPRLRFLGLMRLDADQIRPLLIPGCRSLHTFWMRTPIDVVWLELGDREATVLAKREALAPRRTARARLGASALELASGTAAALGLGPGSKLTLDPVQASE